MEGSATEVWFKVELVHWVMDDPNAKENLLRRMNFPFFLIFLIICTLLLYYLNST
jgi:hypothetical protein